MNRNHDRKTAPRRSARGTIVRLALVALALAGALGGKCEGKPPDFFGLIDGGAVPGTGDIFGRVTVDGTNRSGVTVTLRQGGRVIETTTTDGSGNYRFNDLDPGSYSVSVTPPTGTTCTSEQTAVVVEDQATERNFACTTPVQVGTIQGQVRVDNPGQPGVTVTLLQGGTVIDTEITNATGNYTFPGLTAGTYLVRITPPPGVTCTPPEKPGTVTAGGTTTVDFFNCSEGTSGDFTVNLTNPTPSYRHLGQTSETCTGITTNPAQPGGAWITVWSGPGTVGGTTRSGTLDASGSAVDRQPIAVVGTYTVNASVTASGRTSNATGTVIVTDAPGTCTAPSSRRFKQGIVGLLPDGASFLGLRPVAFRYLAPWGDPAIPQVGLIAEEVVRVFPEAVVLDADGKPAAIYYDVLTGLLIQEIEARLSRSVEAGIDWMAEAP